MIARVDFADEAARYDPIVERHDHLICNRCGALKDVRLELSPKTVGHAVREGGFRVERYRTELYGLCGPGVRTAGAKHRNSGLQDRAAAQA